MNDGCQRPLTLLMNGMDIECMDRNKSKEPGRKRVDDVKSDTGHRYIYFSLKNERERKFFTLLTRSDMVDSLEALSAALSLR